MLRAKVVERSIK